MRILVLGADGYLGWPTAMHFAGQDNEVMALDNGAKREWEMEVDAGPLWHLPSLHQRARAYKEHSRRSIEVQMGDVTDYRLLENVFESFRPDAIVHYAEQPSAPYSMRGYKKAISTQVNNVAGTLAVLWAMHKHAPHAHLIKLGTMGEYGTPNIDIEEGWLEVEHKGRRDRMLYPKKPGSFYHLSKVHDSHNIEAACRWWGLRATDLNQGVVYGIDTPQTTIDPSLATSFHYDAVFGTVLNRFVVQAVAGIPLTVYGKGGQTRGYLNINDTLQCVELAVNNPAKAGEFRVFNQFTETFSVNDLAVRVERVGRQFHLPVHIEHLPNPRIEAEEHYYNPRNSALMQLGLKPRLLSDEVVADMMAKVMRNKHLIDHTIVPPTITWK